MPSEKRQRQDEARYSRRVAEAAQAKRRQRNRQVRTLGVIVAVIAIAALGISVFSGGDDDPVETGASTSTTTDGEAAGTVEVSYPGPGAAIEGETPCPPADGSAERTTSFAQAPPTCIDAAKTYRATVETTEGTFVVELDDERAPVTVNNFVVLARYQYYDGVPFHRIIPGFMDQAGTPVDQASPEIEQTPGYTIPDELPDTSGLASPADAYPEGTLAMANTGAPDSGGSQWFVVIGDGGQSFASNPSYTVFGRVVEGIEVARAINEFGDAATNGTPTKEITITEVTITEQ